MSEQSATCALPRLLFAVWLALAAPLAARPAQPTDLARLVDADAREGFNGDVLVARGSRVLLHASYGRTNPVAYDRRFWLASTGKQFVAAAIMKLVAERRISLDDQLARYFPKAGPDKRPITIRQLLSHTSGLGQSYVSEEQTDRDVAVARMLAEPLAGPPGSAFRYSNSNIQLAAAIIEIVSGTSYKNFVRTYLWDPAGMHSTGFAGDAGARRVTSVKAALPDRLRRPYWGEQGVYSTVADLQRWYAALSAGRVISRREVEVMFAPVTKIGEGYAALGWFRGQTVKGTEYLFVRGNEDFGANSLLYAYRPHDLLIIVLTHAGDADPETSWSRKVQKQVEAALEL